MYYHEAFTYCCNFKSVICTLIRILCACVHIGLSDPLVEIVLMPEKRFKIKALKTDFKTKDLNPSYYKDFKMYVHDNNVHTHSYGTAQS